MCSKLVNNVNKHILLSITEGGHGGYRYGMEACTKVFSRAAKLKKLTQAAECGNNGCDKVFARAADLRRHAKACKPCLYCDDVFKGGKMDHMRPDLYIGFDCSRF